MIELISQALLWFGGALVLIGAAGMLRFPDFYTRSHAATVISVGGFSFALIGIAIQNPLGVYSIKILMVLAVNFITSPTATHALADSTYKLGNMPVKLVRNDLSVRRPEDVKHPVPGSRRKGGSGR